MSVKLIDNDAFYGYRVRRTVDGQLRQVYLTLKKDGVRMNPKQKAKVLAKGKVLDQDLIDDQRQARIANKGNCFREDGSVKGISLYKRKERSGNITPLFVIQVRPEVGDKIVSSSFSCLKNGYEGAWLLAVNRFAEYKEIHKNSNLYKTILGKMPSE